MKLLFSAIAFALCMLSANPSPAQMCSNPSGIIYGLSGAGNIVPITVSSAAVGTTVNASYGGTPKANALGYNTVNGKFYFFEDNVSNTSQQFISFDPSSNQYKVLANSPITSNVVRACINFNGTGYYCLDADANLCFYNISTNTWTLITSSFTDQHNNDVSSTFKSESSGDIAIDGLGNLWIVSSGSSKWGLYKMNAPLPTTSKTSMTVSQIIAPTAPTPGGNPFGGIAFNPTGQIFMSTVNDLYLLGNNLALTHLGAFSTAGVGADLTSCSFPMSVLPVSWTSFSASLQNNKTVLLNWAVDQQIDNKGYSIEHSQDGEHWESLGYKENKDDSSLSSAYTYTDISPEAGKNYYRIEQLDIDGKSSYSETRIITLEAQNHIAIWPNPAKDIVNIQKESNSGVYNLNAQIFDQSGQKVSASLLHSGMNTVNIGSLPAGYYIVHIDLSNGESYNQKLVKL
jgi:hypothetical protein